jgi:ketosteroid isomerase-like protein
MLCRLAVATVLIGANMPASDSTIEDTIRKQERDWNQAILQRDASAMASYLADSYFLAVGIEGQPLLIIPKAQWMETLNVYRIETQSIGDMKVHVYGDTAVVVMTYSQTGSVPGVRDISGNFLITDIWVKTAHGWRVAERHSSRQEKLPVRPK